MDQPENPDFRMSRSAIPRLPSLSRPTAPDSKLQELTESQSNIRTQALSTMPQPASKIAVKRELPQPATVSKRKALSDKALEYPSRTLMPSGSSRPNITGTSLIGASGLKPPSSTRMKPPSTSLAAKSLGSIRTAHPPAERPGPYDRPKTAQSTRLGPRTRSQTAGRPLTSLTAREEPTAPEPAETKHGMMPSVSPPQLSAAASNAAASERKPTAPAIAPNTLHVKPRVSSLNQRFATLSLKENKNNSFANRMAALQENSRTIPNTMGPPSVKPSARRLVPDPRTPERRSIRTSEVAGMAAQTPNALQLSAKVETLHNALRSIAKGNGAVSPCPTAFLTKESNTRHYPAFDVDNRLVNIEQQFSQLKDALNDTVSDRSAMETTIAMLKSRISDQDGEREKYERRAADLQIDLDKCRDETSKLKRQLEEQGWRHKTEVETLSRANKHAHEDFERLAKKETDRLTAKHQEEIDSLKRQHTNELEQERLEKSREIDELKAKLENKHKDVATLVSKKEDEIKDLRAQVEILKSEVVLGQSVKTSLQANVTELSGSNATLEAKINSLRSQIEFLESDNKAQSDSFASMETKLQEAQLKMETAQKKLMKEETERRILFNKYQELKGNIRVMCRVRPAIDASEGESAQIEFPDSEQSSSKISVMGPEERSSLGQVSRKDYPFEFDRVFSPAVNNEEIFDEISQLVQSALDGFNVCIFCYGQTGSGKTYTMSSTDGMIPRATHMIYETVTKLKEKSWTYSMEGSFIEVYNEELNDLLTPADGKAKKLEIRHDDVRKQTTVVNCKAVELTSAGKVESMLAEAQNNRSVAATKANERSSRSHSVFILKLFGENSATGERCEGTLNLVDLAGSERLKHSQAEGERMRETQNINKSLACLGDVIDALGRGSAHVPYRNSKLTHLLQYSLGGNSKTLMFVMMSPLEAHLKETLTSLRFAAKVHNTHIGTAKATRKLRDA
ncbi:Kinesin-like protein klpA [Ceratocystis fimbriata CBS 114723]|uniref:Kinesin-like protein n=1 Tax=Ceratocystis fimbriata CBS 114723 TaxID=1035309 RepID=A0A2C5WW75_9PEZI|nr:Kinesin-like protein klpA [Ceratocystis fimbriata CBS 114723]